MPQKTAQWIDALPTNRLIGEFSVWSADLVNLSADLKRIAGHADVLHVDVADGHFAPALLFFPDLVAALKKTSKPSHSRSSDGDGLHTSFPDRAICRGRSRAHQHPC